MKHYEYRIVDIHGNRASIETELNQYGSDGWELVAIVPCLGCFRYYLKRQIPGPSGE